MNPYLDLLLIVADVKYEETEFYEYWMPALNAMMEGM